MSTLNSRTTDVQRGRKLLGRVAKIGVQTNRRLREYDILKNAFALAFGEDRKQLKTVVDTAVDSDGRIVVGKPSDRLAKDLDGLCTMLKFLDLVGEGDIIIEYLKNRGVHIELRDKMKKDHRLTQDVKDALKANEDIANLLPIDSCTTKADFMKLLLKKGAELQRGIYEDMAAANRDKETVRKITSLDAQDVGKAINIHMEIVKGNPDKASEKIAASSESLKTFSRVAKIH
jgi:hypothetical protein